MEHIIVSHYNYLEEYKLLTKNMDFERVYQMRSNLLTLDPTDNESTQVQVMAWLIAKSMG